MAVQSKLDIKTIQANKNIGARNYWKTRLEGFEFGEYFDNGSHISVTGEYAEYNVTAPGNIHNNLEEIAGSHKAKHIILLATAGIMAQKYSSLDEVAIFTPVYAENNTADGNTIIPVRMNKKTGMNFEKILVEVRDNLVKDYSQSNYPVEKIISNANAKPGEIAAVGLLVEEIQHEQAFENVTPALLIKCRVSEQLSVKIKYAVNKFDAVYIAQMAGLYFELLGNLLKNRAQDACSIEIISPAEKEKITRAFNNTQKTFPHTKTIIDLFAQQVQKRPGKIAVRIYGQQITYSQLNARSNQAAHYIIQNGLQKGSIVGVKLDRSLEMIIAINGILKAGCIYLPLTKEYPVERVRYVLRNSNVQMLFTDKAGIDEWSGECRCVEVNETTTCPEKNINLATPADIAYIIYTSGSTGQPKGVLIKHRSVVNRLNWMQNEYKLDENDIILQKTPVVFDVSVWELFWWSLNGAKLVLAAPGMEKDPDALCKLIDAEKITVLHFVPALLNAMVNHLKESQQVYSLQSIKHVFASGEELNASYAQSFLSYCSQAALHNLYGPTEATVDVSYHPVSRSANYRKVPIGKPIDNTTLYIFNPQGQLQPVGVPGELLIGGENLSVGYLNQVELTHEKFTRNPLDETTVLYKTGDLVRWLPDGSIEFLGRIDNQVKIRGNRIEIGEIEHAVKTFAAIKEAILLTKETASGLQLVAYIIVNNEAFVEEELREYLKVRLPEYMMPSYFIQVNEIPVTVNGKVDRKKLLALKAGTAATYVAPETELEKLLAQQWMHILGNERVGTTENFFRIGGDSILAVRLIGAINNELPVNLSMTDLYEHETIQQLAGFIEQSKFNEITAAYKLIQDEVDGFNDAYLLRANSELIEAAYPMSDIEKAMCYVHQSRPEDVLYFEQIMLPVDYEKFDVDILQKALNLLVQKHEILRTGFELEEFVHIVYKNASCKIIYHDYSLLGVEEQKRTIQANLEISRQQHFDLKSFPLWRLIVYKLKESHHEVLFEYHHAIIDGWSIASLITELNNTYVSLVRNEMPEIQPLACTYKDYIIEELYHKKSKDTIDFWKTELDQYKKLRLNVSQGAKIFKSVRETYPETLVADLEKAAVKLNTTVKNILLAAHLYAMKTLCCENDILTGLVTFTRPLKKDGDKLLGCFLNTIPFRLKVPQQATWLQLLGMIDKKMLELRKYEHLSLFEISRVIGARTTDGNPLFDTLFNFINFHIGEDIEFEKTAGEQLERLEFDSFLRGHTFFDVNYNVNRRRMLWMHEYSSPFMNEETFAQYAGLFNSGIAAILEAPGEVMDDGEEFWNTKTAKVKAEIQHYGHDVNSAGKIMPVSFHQQRLWAAEKQPNTQSVKVSYYNIPLIIDVEGKPENAILEKSIRAIIKRHEILKAQIIEIGGKPYLKIKEETGYKLHVKDVKGKQAMLNELVNAEINRPFETGELLVRATLFKIQEGSYKLVVTFHNIIADRYSVIQLTEEMMVLYNSWMQGKGGGKKEAALQYGSFSLWQQESLIKLTPLLLAYWRNRLGNEWKPLEMPGRRQGAVKGNYSSGSIELVIPSVLVEKILEYEKATGINARILLMAAFTIVLHKYAQQQEIAIGTVVDNRENEKLLGLIGPIANIIIIKCLMKAGAGFDEYVSTLGELYAEGLKHQLLPFELLVKELAQENGADEELQLKILFQYDDRNYKLPVIEGLDVRVSETNQGYGKYDINLLLKRKEKDVRGTLVYNAACYDHLTIELFLKHYVEVLKNVISNPGEALGNIEFITPAEKLQLLYQFNNTATPYQHEENIISLFDRQVNKSPGNIAVLYGDRAMTYRELQKKSYQIAVYLQASAKIKEGDLVGIMLEREEYLMPCIFGILRAGAAYVPVDPNYPVERINAIIDDSKIKYLISRPRYLYPFINNKTGVINLDEALGNMPVLPVNEKINKASAKGLAYVIYTSGSTGKPKGVMIEHHAVINRLEWMQKQYPVGPGDVLLQKTPLVFDVSVWELFWWSFTGASLCLLKPGGEKEPREIIAAIEKHKVTTIHFVPSMLGVFLFAVKEEKNVTARLQSLKQVFSSGEALKIEQVKLFGKTINANCGTKLVNLYGPTEATVDVCCYECSFDEEEGMSIPIGVPIDNIRLYILDTTGGLIPTGIPGELCIAGVGLARGYLNNEKLTNEKFIEHPRIKGERIYKTGDLAKWLPDGNIEYLGRIDNQVKIRGYRIEPGEIENVMTRYEGIHDAVVVAVSNNNGEYSLVGYYTGVAADEVKLKEHLHKHLPGYMVPAFISYLPVFPINSNGKADRSKLQDMKTQQALKTTYEPPRDELETQLAEIWQKLFGKERPGINDDFFELGGHSLMAIRMASGIQKRWGIEITVATILQFPTINALAEIIRALQNNAVVEEYAYEEIKL